MRQSYSTTDIQTLILETTVAQYAHTYNIVKLCKNPFERRVCLTKICDSILFNSVFIISETSK